MTVFQAVVEAREDAVKSLKTFREALRLWSLKQKEKENNDI